VVSSDKAAATIRAFLDILDRTNDPVQVARMLPILKEFVPSLLWEGFFSPHQSHPLGNQMRKWLSVTQTDAPWLEEGKTLFSKLQT